MEKEFWAAVAERRSFYSINKEVHVSQERIEKIIEKAILHTPSAFHSQSARIVLLLGDQHGRFWNMVKEALRKIVSQDQFGDTDKKIDSFNQGYGTILFFEDLNVVDDLQRQYTRYADNFPIWSQQSNGMHQFVIWTALCSEGLGASLQHYTELIEEDTKREWDLPKNWTLIAQMPFGNPAGAPGPKGFAPLEGRIVIKK